MALDDDAVLAAVRRVRERGQPVDSFRVAVELHVTDDRGDPDHTTVEVALRQLVSDGRLMHRPVIVEWTTNPDSREVLDFYDVLRD